MVLEDQNALAHYGVKGMHWGQRNYQYKDGTYTELGKKRRRVGYKEDESGDDKEKKANTTTSEEDEKIGGKAYKDMTRRELRAAKKRARHNEAERRATREFNRDKREAIEKGDISFISKNISRFSNDEIDEAVNRYKKMQTLMDLDKANRKDADHFIDKALKYLDKGSKGVQSVTNIVNNINDAMKKTAERKKSQLDLLYTENPKLKPLTEQQEITNANLRKTGENTEATRDQNREKARQEKEKADQEAIKTQSFRDEYERDKAFYDDAKAAKEAKKQAEKEAKEAREAEERARKEAEEQGRQEQEDFAWNLWRKAEKAREKAEKEARKAEKKAAKEEKKAQERAREQAEQDELFKMFTNQGEYYRSEWDSESPDYNIGSLFKKNKSKTNVDDEWQTKTKKEFDDLNSKMLSDLNNAYKDYYKTNNDDKFGSKSKSKTNGNVRDSRWYKDIKKNPGDSRIVDKWVNEMKKKYIKEHGMSKEAAEQKAEEYVDYWLDMYDDGAFDKKK